jgi:hypothetical protein
MDALGSKRRKSLGCFTMFLIAIGIAATAFLGSDQLCSMDIRRRLPNYPSAVVVKSEHNGIRLQAMGKSTLVFSTPDDPETVAQWYRQLTLEQLKKNRYSGLAAISRWSEANPDGQGTLIYYLTECGL